MGKKVKKLKGSKVKKLNVGKDVKPGLGKDYKKIYAKTAENLSLGKAKDNGAKEFIKKLGWDQEALDFFEALYVLSKGTINSCYREMQKQAKLKGWKIPKMADVCDYVAGYLGYNTDVALPYNASAPKKDRKKNLMDTTTPWHRKEEKI